MTIIAHRGNLEGPNPALENHPDYIDSALSEGFDAEIDVWVLENGIFLGHDKPDFPVSLSWFFDRCKNIWIHCKNFEALCFFQSASDKNDFNWKCRYNYFWHQSDSVTLTSLGFIWAYPGNQPIAGSVAVLPEIHNDDVSDCYAICTDYSRRYL